MRASKIFVALMLLLCVVGVSYADGVNYKHIRNATARIEYAGNVFLVDPFLADKGAYPGFEGTPNSEKRIPLIDMAEPVSDEYGLRYGEWD